jgi:hypothetical protein
MTVSGSENRPIAGRRWRLDDRKRDLPTDSRSTGRTVVIGLVAAILALWIGLDLTFRAWKAHYNALAEFGASQVAPMIDPLASIAPPNVPATDWQMAVSDTHAMLLALTGSGLLDEAQMDDLRREIASRVAATRPETARKTLAGLWDDLERKAGPIIAPDRTPPPPNSRHARRNPRPARPKILGPLNSASATGDRSGSP